MQVLLYISVVSNPSAQLALWIFYSVVVLILAATFSLISPVAPGSGIPQLKVLIVGAVPWEKYLGWRTFIAKALGLVFAAGAGVSLCSLLLSSDIALAFPSFLSPCGSVVWSFLSVYSASLLTILVCVSAGMVHGTEGAFAHIAALIARAGFRFPLFKRIAASPELQRQMITAAAAAGIAAAFGSVFGAVLFSIEVTADLYDITNYWDSFAAAIPSAIISRVFSALINGDTNYLQSFTPYSGPAEAGTSLTELLLFFCMGCLLGIVAAGFVWLHALLALLIKRTLPRTHRRQMYVVRLISWDIFVIVPCVLSWF